MAAIQGGGNLRSSGAGGPGGGGRKRADPDDPAQYGGPNEAGTEWVKKKPPPHIAADMMTAMTWKAKQKEIKKEWEQKHLGGGLEKTISQKLRESKGS